MRPWNRNQILSTQLFRLGYLEPDSILRQYRDQLGTGAGQAVFEKKSNVVIVTDTAPALEKLRSTSIPRSWKRWGFPPRMARWEAKPCDRPASGPSHRGTAFISISWLLPEFARFHLPPPRRRKSSPGVIPKPTSGPTSADTLRLKTNTRESMSLCDSPGRRVEKGGTSPIPRHALARRAEKAQDSLRRGHAPGGEAQSFEEQEDCPEKIVVRCDPFPRGHTIVNRWPPRRPGRVKRVVSAGPTRPVQGFGRGGLTCAPSICPLPLFMAP